MTSFSHNDEPPSPISPVSEGGNPNVFSDEYAESFNESYADSIAAHSIQHSRSPSPSPERPSQPQRDSYRIPLPGLTNLSHSSSMRSSRSRLSTSKNNDGGNERSQDDVRRPIAPPIATGLTGRNPGSSALAHRSLSSASEFAGSQSPMSPGEGPSHPYAMYPQNLAMSRTTSMASTARPLSHTTSLRGPAHPYGLYSQNVGEDPPPGNQQNAIPVGFPGATSNFSRRLGPEGEDQDIIGPDGHTEQLPPYSRYPDGVNHKTVATSTLPAIGEQRAEETSPTTPLNTTSPTDVISPITQRSATTYPGDTEHQDSNFNEKTWEGKTTKEKWNTKVFGVPLWFVLLLFVLVVIIAVVCGGVLGSIVSGNKGGGKKQWKPSHTSMPDSMSSSSSSPQDTASTTTLLDVSLPTSPPSWIPLPPTGVFPVNPGEVPSLSQSGCLQAPQQPAWSCDLHDDTTQINITRGADNRTSVSIVPAVSDLLYGVQPPSVSASPVQLVQDLDATEDVYAWHFQTLYDKVVVLDDNTLQPLNSPRKRDTQKPWYASSNTYGQGKSIENEDDEVDEERAWFCYWNQTFVEVLIYADNSSSTSSSIPSPTSAPATPPTPTISDATSPPSQSATSAVTQLYSTGPLAPSMHNGPAIVPSLTGGSFSTYPPRNPAQPGGPTTPIEARELPSISPAPQKIKIEERRIKLPNAPPPTCTLMTHNVSDNQWRPCISPQGMMFVVALNDTDPPEASKPRNIEARGTRSDYLPTNACGCVWKAPASEPPQ